MGLRFVQLESRRNLIFGAETRRGERESVDSAAGPGAPGRGLLGRFEGLANDQWLFGSLARRRWTGCLCPFLNGLSFTPARRALDSPIAIACWVEQAAC